MRDDLPPGWALAKLPDLIAPGGLITDGDWVETKDQDPEGSVRLTQLADVGDGSFRDRSNRFLTIEKAEELACTLLEPGDVLIARMPDPLGRACLFLPLPQPCVTVVDVCIVRPGTGEIHPDCLMYIINTPQFRVAVASLQSGSTRKRISKKNLCKIQVPVAPTQEQHRLASALDSYFTRLDAAKQALNRVQANLKRYRASVLKAAVEGRLVPTEAELARKEGREYEHAEALLERILAERRRKWEEAQLEKMRAKGKEPENDKWKAKYKEPAAPDTSELPELPEGWCWISPSQVFGWSSGSFLPKKRHRTGAIPVYGGNGVSGLHDEALLQSPTLVIGRVGAHCGNVHVTDGPSWITDNAIYATPVPGSAYLPYWHLVLGQQNLNANAAGTGQPYVNQRHLNELVVPLPPQQEQIRLVEAVQRLSSQEEYLEKSQVTTAAARLARLRQSILKWAFEGKLVDQDPNDEPASVLLQRIRAEREAARPAKRKRKNKST